MDFRPNEEQEALQKAVREFLAKEAKNIAREAEETEEGYSLELWQKMTDLGWMGVSFPEECGGTGGDFVDLILLLEEMGRTLVPGPFISAVVCSGHAILKYGSEAQKKEFLPRLTKGKLLITPALIEPTSFATEGLVKERVTVENGDYILSGTRLFVPYAHLADWFIYGTDTNKGKTLFLVNAKIPGLTCNLLKTIAPDRQYEVVMDGIRVPEANILGKIGEGKKISSKIEEWGALSQCAFILGLLERVLQMSVEYAKKRVQFERPIGSFQAIQHQCADMATDVDQVKFLTYKAAWKLSEQLPATKEVSMAKARASDASRRVCLLGTKIHGGIGIIVDYDMQLYFRWAKAAELVFGDGNFHREIIAQQIGF
jgi:alkylation response protein AidB-like acyl-CoA dehydrogenase